MSNPATVVEQFNGSPGDFTGVDPIRYSNGLWLEQAATNLVSNPAAITNTTGWAAQANVQLDRITSLPGPLPDELSGVATCFRATATGVLSGDVPIASTTVTLATAGQHNHSWYIWVPAGFTGSSARVGDAAYTAATSRVAANLDLSKRDQWQRVTGARFIADAGDLVGNIQLRLTTGSVQIGETIYFVAVQAESGIHPTSFVEASRGAGYSNSPSPHSRAASSASVPTAGIISPNSGSLAFRFTRKLDTGTLEPILEVGENAAGYDHLQIFIDADTLWVAWDSEGALPQAIDTGHTMVVDQEYFIYTYWDGLVFGVSIDNGTPVIANRDVPTGDWGTFPLTLAAE